MISGLNGLLAVFKKRLITHTYTEKGFAGGNKLTGGFKELLLAHSVNAIIKRAYSWQDNGIRLHHQLRAGHQMHVAAGRGESLLHAADIARAIIKQCDHGASCSLRSHFGQFLFGAQP